MGYRSCALVPAIVDGSSVFVLTLLSKKEDRFDNSLIETSNLVSNMVAYQAVARAEKERSISLAKYFDAAFNSDFIQLLIDRSGVIIKANKATFIDLEKTQKEVHGKNVSDFFSIDRTALDAMAKGHSMEFYSKQRTKDIYRIACSSVSDKLLLLSAYNITDLKILEEEARLSEHDVNDVFFILDADTKILWISNNAERVLRVQKELLLGNELSNLIFGEKELAGNINASKGAYAKPVRLSIGNDLFIDVQSYFVKNSFGGFSCVLSRTTLRNMSQACRRR